MVDINRQDFFIPIPAAISDDTPASWYEGWIANVAYNNMPLVESIQEAIEFKNEEYDYNFNVAENISEDVLPYYDDLVKAKNERHLRYLEARAREAIERRRIASNAPLTAQIAGGFTDPLAVTAFIPGLNYVKLGKTFTQAVGRGAIAGLGYGVASEARRAPFAVADEPGEAVANVAASTIFSAGFGGVLKGAGYAGPFLASSASKVNKLYQGKSFKHVFGKTDEVAELDEAYTPAEGGNLDLVQTNILGSFTNRVMGNKKYSEKLKNYFALLAYNGSVSTQGARRGYGFQSVSQESVTYQGLYEGLRRKMEDLHSLEVRGIKKASRVATVPLPFTGFDDWAGDTIRRYILRSSPDPRLQRIGNDGISDQQKEAGVLMTELFGGFRDDIHYYKMRTDEKLLAYITKIQNEVDTVTNRLVKLEADINKMPNKAGTKKQIDLLKTLENRQSRLRARITDYEVKLGQFTREDYTFPIFYNKELLSTSDEARQTLTRIFSEDYEAQRLAAGKDTLGTFEDAESTLRKILQEDGDDMQNPLRDTGKKPTMKHLKTRKTNVDVAKVIDFIHADMQALHTYIDRMGRQVSFANKYGGRSIDEVLEDLEYDARVDGLNDKEIASLKAGFYGDYERVMGTLQRSNDRWDTQALKAARAWTAWTYLPLAGVSAITDAGSIVMAHGMKDVIQAGIAATDTAFLGKAIKEAQLAGELYDVTKNVYAREMLNDTVRRVKPTKLEKTIQVGNQVFYTANLLAPFTFAGKSLDTLIVQNKFIKQSRNWANGTISKFEREYLARYGIDEDMAKFIAKAPTQKHESRDFEISNTDAWDQSTSQAREIVRKYQAALASHANNTIVMGQTFDKPLIMDGVVYMRDNPFFQSVRKTFPTQFKIEKRLRTGDVNMVRVESGLLTIPFTFMNFAFGANNKILGAIRDPNRRYRMQGIVALLGLSYLSLAAKKPDYWFEKRTSPDIMARIVDHSGVLGIYSDLAYTGLQIAGNTGVVTKDAIIPPKYINPDRDERLLDAFIEPFGAPAGLATDYYRSIDDYFAGRESDAAERLKYSLPFIGLQPFRDDMREFVGSVGRN